MDSFLRLILGFNLKNVSHLEGNMTPTDGGSDSFVTFSNCAYGCVAVLSSA